MFICHCNKHTIRIIEICESGMVWKLVITNAISSDSDSILIWKSPTIVVDPFHKQITNPWLPV